MTIAQSQKIVKFITLAQCYIIRIIPSRPVFAIVENQLDMTFLIVWRGCNDCMDTPILNLNRLFT